MGRVETEDTSQVRLLGVLVESIHAVVYFAPEPQAAYSELGLKGYWRGYFASRAAPLGAAGPQLVTALFGGFAPAMVGRAVPGVWEVTSPQQVQAARLAGGDGRVAPTARRPAGDGRGGGRTYRSMRAGAAAAGPADGGRTGRAAPPRRAAGGALA
jgi:hypothetical protein